MEHIGPVKAVGRPCTTSATCRLVHSLVCATEELVTLRLLSVHTILIYTSLSRLYLQAANTAVTFNFTVTPAILESWDFATMMVWNINQVASADFSIGSAQWLKAL